MVVSQIRSDARQAITWFGPARLEVASQFRFPCKRTDRGSHAIALAQQGENAVLRNKSSSSSDEYPFLVHAGFLIAWFIRLDRDGGTVNA
jgi:hypothetical protein